MRILFSGVPAFGHLLPLVPLTRAAARAQHEVGLLTSAGMAGPLAAEFPGMPVLGAGPLADVLFAEVAERFPGSDPASDPQPDTVAEFFAGARVDLSIDEAVAVGREWSPDLIVCEAVDFVGPLLAAILGVPYATVAFGPALPEEFSAPMFELVRSRYEARGVEPQDPAALFDPAPASLQDPAWVAPPNRLAVRAEAHRRPQRQEPLPAFDDPEKPTVLVTLGTVFDDDTLLGRIVGSLEFDFESRNVNVVATVGVLPRARPVDDTSSVHYAEFRPLDELLDGVDVVVTAGGAGTVLAALSRGIPMVILPQGADQFVNAARAAAAGASLTISDAGEVGRAVATVLTEGSFAASARVARNEIALQPPPEEALAELVGRVDRTAARE